MIQAGLLTSDLLA